MAKGRVSRDNIPVPKIVTEYRPRVNDPKASRALKVAYDDVYALRRQMGPQETSPKQPLDVSLTVEADETFNPGGGGGQVLLTNFILGMTVWPIGSQVISTGGVGTSDDVVAVLFMVPSDITISVVVIEVTTLVASSNVGVGWYSEDGLTLVWETGPISSASTGVKRTTLSAPVKVPAGMYWHSWTASSLNVRCRSIVATSNFFGIFNSGTVRLGAGTGGSGGSLPSTLPSLSNPTGAQAPIYALGELL